MLANLSVMPPRHRVGEIICLCLSRRDKNTSENPNLGLSKRSGMGGGLSILKQFLFGLIVVRLTLSRQANPGPSN